MKINHEQTKIELLQITALIRKHAETVTNFIAENKSVLDNEMLSQKAKTDKTEELSSKLKTALTELKTGIATRLEFVKNIESNNENILELDIPEFANTLAVCESGCFPLNKLDGILKNFAGNKQILSILKNALEKSGTDRMYLDMFNDYITDAETAIDKLIMQINAIDESPDMTKSDLLKVFNNIIYFGECHGITFSKTEKISGIDTEEFKEDRMRKAMGL